jgi:hypothetical protein
MTNAEHRALEKATFNFYGAVRVKQKLTVAEQKSGDLIVDAARLIRGPTSQSTANGGGRETDSGLSGIVTYSLDNAPAAASSDAPKKGDGEHLNIYKVGGLGVVL